MSPPADDTDFEGDVFGSGGFDPEEMDELFDVLSDARRRCALDSLCEAGGTMSFDDLVDDVTRRTVTESPSHDERREVAAALHHVHLPKLRSAGLVAETDSDGAVRLAERLEALPPTLFDSA